MPEESTAVTSVDFGRSTVWSFQFLDRLIKNDLYFRHQARGRQQSAAAAASATPDPAAASGVARGTKRPARDMYAEHFGRVDPRHIPESGSWWKARQTEVTAVGDDHELGQMTHMVTVTQNDLAPELIAHARRGPCAVPTQEEKFAYLLTRRAPSDRRPNIQEDATAAVLSYQRRMHSVKQNFLVRHKRTPLGVCVVYWDRTVAQTREALHGHVLGWNKRRKISATDYRPRPAITELQARRWDAAAGPPATGTAPAKTSAPARTTAPAMVPPPTAVCDEQVSLPTAETSVPPQIRRPVLRKTTATATATESLRAPLDSRPALPAVASMNAEDDMYYCRQNNYRQAQYY